MTKLEEARAALCALADAFDAVQSICDGWASSGPEGYTKDERRQIATAGRVREKAGRVLAKAIHGAAQ